MELREMAVERSVQCAVRVLTLENFRNFGLADLELSPGVNLVYGENAQGKTNLLESVHLLSTTRLLRGTKDADAIKIGESAATLNMQLAVNGTTVGMRLEHRMRKRAFLNSSPLARAADIIGRVPTISFSIASMPIARGEPSDKRLFLDLELSQLSAPYLRHFTVYKRALDQRNALLKASQEREEPSEHFEVWENELAIHGLALRAFRLEFMDEISRSAGALYSRLAPVESMELKYLSSGDERSAEELEASLARERTRDILRGTTSVGPHRDSFMIEIDGKDARNFGSQGQQRSAVLALKMATMDVAAHRTGSPPILLLDDVFSDLDHVRRDKLLEMVQQQGGQVLLTCTEPTQVGAELLKGAQLIQVVAGKIAST